jgi:hypothetical protein
LDWFHRLHSCLNFVCQQSIDVLWSHCKIAVSRKGLAWLVISSYVPMIVSCEVHLLLFEPLLKRRDF